LRSDGAAIIVHSGPSQGIVLAIKEQVKASSTIQGTLHIPGLILLITQDDLMALGSASGLGGAVPGAAKSVRVHVGVTKDVDIRFYGLHLQIKLLRTRVIAVTSQTNTR